MVFFNMAFKIVAVASLALPGTKVKIEISDQALRWLSGDWNAAEKDHIRQLRAPEANRWLSNVLITFALEFGKFLARNLWAAETVATVAKGSPKDLVTKIDKGIEKILEDWIRMAFPTHSIVGEEGEKAIRDPNHIWFIDPVDGTKNFLTRRKDVGITFCLIQDRLPYASVVYVPRTRELYYSNWDGAFVLDCVDQTTESLHPKEFDRENIMIGTEHSRADKETDERFLANLTRNLKRAGFESGEDRIIGSMSHGMVYLAAGGLDLFYKRGAKTWDVLPAASIIYQAGGEVVVLDHGGVPLFPFPAPVLAAIRQNGSAPLGNIIGLPHSAPQELKQLLTACIGNLETNAIPPSPFIEVVEP